MFIFWFGVVPFHIAIFLNSPRIEQQTHMWAKIGQSSDKKVSSMISLICGPVELLLPHPAAECVKNSRGSTWSKEETECLLDIGPKYPTDIPAGSLSSMVCIHTSPKGPKQRFIWFGLNQTRQV